MLPTAPRALVCDADTVSARLIRRMLEQGGLAVETVPSAAECEAAVDATSCSLLVTALLLPDGDGLGLIRRLRVRYPQLPIVMVSAVQAGQRALEAGADAFLSKPVNATALLTTARSLIDQGAAA